MKHSFNPVNGTDLLGRKSVEIDLTRPFREIVATALALPQGNEPVDDKQVVTAARGIYEALHGRSVDTTVGMISIAPGICPWLVVRHFEVITREDFLATADRWLARVLAGRGAIEGQDFVLPQSFPNGAHDMDMAGAHRKKSKNPFQTESQISP